METTNNPKRLSGQAAFAVLRLAHDLYHEAHHEAARWRQEIGTLSVAAYVNSSDQTGQKYETAQARLTLLETTVRALEPLYIQRDAALDGKDIQIEVTPLVLMLQESIMRSPFVDQEDNRPEPISGCPICGNTDGVFHLENSTWFCCDEHRTRWSCDEGLISEPGREDDEQRQNNAEFLSQYAEVEPIPPDVDRDEH